jgi:mannose-6-phosphate isomerase-like protein (cupin superfamily)
MILLFAAAILAAGPVEIWSGGDLKSASSGLAAEAQSKAIAGKTIGAASVWRRSRSGEAELHKTKTDLIVIEEGSATLVYGGTIRGAHATQANEIRGTAIEGGESRKLGPGDVIRIPANTPHQFVLDKGQSVGYFALKLAR